VRTPDAHLQYWDFATLSALFFTATVTPYEVCLMWEEPKFHLDNWATPLFFINWVVNAVFIIDIFKNFFTPYKEPLRKGGGIVKSHKKIARSYLTSWFLLDFISVLPVDNVMMAIDTSNLSGAGALGAIRMLRLLRLIKLARIFRASRIFSRWENSISISYSSRALIFWGVIVVFMLHMLACSHGLLAQLMSAIRPEHLQIAVKAEIDGGNTLCYGCTPDDDVTSEVCSSLCLTPCEITKLAEYQLGVHANSDQLAARELLIFNQENWICRYHGAGVVTSMPTWHGEIWVASLYVALIQLGGGVGSIVPQNFPEYLLFFVGILLGSVTWAMVVGTICATLSTGDPYTIAFKQNMDALNYFLDDMNIDPKLHVGAREYLRNTRDLYKKREYNNLRRSCSICPPSSSARSGFSSTSRTMRTPSTARRVWSISRYGWSALATRRGRRSPQRSSMSS
jgi:hypothetical protein